MAKLSPALKACYHMMRRYRTDANFAHEMQMTQSLEMIQDAIAKAEGKPPMTFEQRLADQQDVQHRRESDVRRLEKEVEELEGKLAKYQDDTGEIYVDPCDDDAGFSISGVLELIEQAKWRGIDITPDQLTDALEGRRVFI